MRTTEIRIQATDAYNQYDSYYAVDLYEDDEFVATIDCKDKSIHWCRSLAENWVAGILKPEQKLFNE